MPVPGGVLIRDAAGALLGAVGISGDTSDNDEVCAVAGIAGGRPQGGHGRSSMSAVLFRDVRIFDGTGSAPYAGEVLVRDQSIAAVSPQGPPSPRSRMPASSKAPAPR